MRYLSINWSDFTQIPQTPMENDLIILKLEYLGNHLLDHTHVLNWSLYYDQTIFCQSFTHEGNLQWKMTSKYNIINHLSHPLLDCSQILNLSLYDQTIFCKSLELRRPRMEVEYLSNHLLDHSQILSWSLYDKTIFCKSFKWRQPQNIKIGISQQPLIGSYSNYKLKFIWPNNIL